MRRISKKSMRADELACEGLKNKNKMYLQKFLLTIFFVLLSAKGTKQLYGEAQPGIWKALVCYVIKRDFANQMVYFLERSKEPVMLGRASSSAGCS